MNLSITAFGQKEYERTKQYVDKVEAIKKDVRNKYKLLITSETNFIKKIVLVVKRGIETKHEINKISKKSLWINRNK